YVARGVATAAWACIGAARAGVRCAARAVDGSVLVAVGQRHIFEADDPRASSRKERRHQHHECAEGPSYPALQPHDILQDTPADARSAEQLRRRDVAFLSTFGPGRDGLR